MKLSLILWVSRFSNVQSHDHVLRNVGDDRQEAAKRSGLCPSHVWSENPLILPSNISPVSEVTTVRRHARRISASPFSGDVPGTLCYFQPIRLTKEVPDFGIYCRKNKKQDGLKTTVDTKAKTILWIVNTKSIRAKSHWTRHAKYRHRRDGQISYPQGVTHDKGGGDAKSFAVYTYTDPVHAMKAHGSRRCKQTLHSVRARWTRVVILTLCLLYPWRKSPVPTEQGAWPI